MRSERIFLGPRRLTGGQRTDGGQVSPTGRNRSYALDANLRATLPRRVTTRRSEKQTLRTARAVLTTPFDVDPRQMLPAYLTGVSPSQSRWTSPELPASPRNGSGTTDATSLGECASHNGPEDEAAVKQETGWNQPQEMR